MKNQDIIKRAQTECGEYVTGYRFDITFNSLNAICEAMWKRSINLSFTVSDWFGQVADVLGKQAFIFWADDIQEFAHKKENECKYFCFHGQKYCA